MKRIISIILSLVILITMSVGCTNKKDKKSIKIAEQYGLAYAPLQIMKAKGFLEKALPNLEIKWQKLGNTAAIREAVLAGKVDVGFMGIPPFLIGVDNGMKWKMMSGISSCPLGLVTYDPSIKTLKDFSKLDKIALPQPGSIQHILLSMAAEKQLGSATIFDKQLVTMKHPDGVNALNAKKEIKAHFTSPPYLFKELQNPENHLVVTGEEAVGKPFTFIVGVATEDFHNSYSKYYNEFLKQLYKSIKFINENPNETIEILSKAYNLDKDILKGYLNYKGMKYSKEILGVEQFIDFMHRNGYLKNKYTIKDVVWE